jgi:hypothetical protein
MRRNISPRELIDRKFAALDKFMGTPAVEMTADRIENMRELLAETRELSVSFSENMPAVDPAAMHQLIEDGGVDAYVQKHLNRQIPYLEIEGVDAQMLATRGWMELKSVDLSVSVEDGIRKAAEAAIHAFPTIVAPDYSSDRLESVLRESVGLDGTIMERKYTADQMLDSAVAALSSINSKNPALDDTPASEPIDNDTPEM